MPKTHQHLSETHILGARTRQWVVRAGAEDRRPWLKDAPVCPALGQHHIAHAGIAEAVAPYRIVRMRQSGTYFLACFAGQGRILVDGRWQTCRAGTACLLPSHILNAFHADPSHGWEFCWVRYEASPERRPISTTASPVLAKFDAEPLRAAILGLYHECQGPFIPATQHHWAELIQTYVLRFARPTKLDERLSKLWDKVGADLGRNWSLSILAAESHLSSEHLRRLSRQHLGRSPMHQVTYLRMRRAAELLTSTGDKIETISTAVGYANPFVFSTTFKKWIGWRPSEHRKRSA
ncbi:MAG TPA: AraC family transcriptional regulator [Roseimicrobium sp.]|nr:AraC family transcriptional regulator [Roseimicrobium sp.]